MVACGVWRVAPRAASSVNILREVRIPDTTRTWFILTSAS